MGRNSDISTQPHARCRPPSLDGDLKRFICLNQITHPPNRCEDMNTAAAPHAAHISSVDVYDPDEVVPSNSPLLQPRHISLHVSPSPPPQVPLSQVSPLSSPGGIKSNGRRKIKPSQGDGVLIQFMGDGKNPQLAAAAATEALPSDISEDSHHYQASESDFEPDERQPGAATSPYAPPGGGMSPHPTSPPPAAASLMSVAGSALSSIKGIGGQGAQADRPLLQAGEAPPAPPPRPEGPAGLLKSFAMGALGLSLQGPEDETPQRKPGSTPASIDIAATREKAHALEPSHVVATTPRDFHARDDRSVTMSAPSPYSPNGIYSPLQQGRSPIHQGDLRSPGSLPPMQGLASPRSDTNGQNLLPSIREQLGDITAIPADAMPDGRHRAGAFAHSPPGPGIPTRLSAINHTSPPISPNDVYRRDLPSPGQIMGAPSPYQYYSMNGHARGPDYNSSATETPSTDHSASTPATSTSITDRMSIDGLTHPQVGAYVCKVPGCTAPPFQTQYLLNSHANVHSSARPHYCSVKGCSRAEGGKGFKRKNEMIRHGLVHDSPGYVCPFCPDREHKYPRPDNLQRCVSLAPFLCPEPSYASCRN